MKNRDPRISVDFFPSPTDPSLLIISGYAQPEQIEEIERIKDVLISYLQEKKHTVGLREVYYCGYGEQKNLLKFVNFSNKPVFGKERY